MSRFVSVANLRIKEWSEAGLATFRVPPGSGSTMYQTLLPAAGFKDSEDVVVLRKSDFETIVNNTNPEFHRELELEKY